MNLWVQEINEQPHLCAQFAPEEIPMLEKWHKVITRLTKIDYSPIIERKEDE